MYTSHQFHPGRLELVSNAFIQKAQTDTLIMQPHCVEESWPSHTLTQEHSIKFKRLLVFLWIMPLAFQKPPKDGFFSLSPQVPHHGHH